MVKAATQAAEQQGYTLARLPGRGLSSIWEMTKDGKTQITAIRTTRDRWIAFPPLDGGKKWKTLSDVELVLVASVDDRFNPKGVHVHLIPADAVRKRFDVSYQTRVGSGHTVRDNYGMWVMLDKGDPNNTSQSGSGLALDYPAIAKYTLDELAADSDTIEEFAAEADDAPAAESVEQAAPANVGEVMAWARDHIARLTGMKPEAIKLDLKIEY